MSRTISTAFKRFMAAASFMLCAQFASADVSGDWVLSIQIMGQAVGGSVSMQADEGELTGHYSGTLGGEGDISGSTTGDEFEFSLPVGAAVLTYTGALRPDGTVAGTVDFGGTAGTFTGRKTN